MSYKLVTGVTTYNRVNYLKRFVSSWKKTTSEKSILIIADDGSKDGTKEYIKSIASNRVMPIFNNRIGVAAQTNTIFKKSLELGFDYGFKADDDIWFTKSGWENLYVDNIIKSGYDHLCYQNKKWTGSRRDVVIQDGLKANICVIKAMGCFWTYTPKCIEKVGYFDDKSFGFMGHEHIDYSMRCCRADLNTAMNFFDSNYSDQYIDMQSRTEQYISSLRGRESKVSAITKEEEKRRWNIIMNDSRVFINYC